MGVVRLGAVVEAGSDGVGMPFASEPAHVPAAKPGSIAMLPSGPLMYRNRNSRHPGGVPHRLTLLMGCHGQPGVEEIPRNGPVVDGLPHRIALQALHPAHPPLPSATPFDLTRTRS